jgi:conjugative transposon TraM protein
MDIKQMDSKKLVAYGILAIFLVVIVIVAVSSGKGKDTDVNEVRIEDKGSTYDSKLAAYKAREGEKPSSGAYRYNVDEYLKQESAAGDGNDIYQQEDEEVQCLQQSLKQQDRPKAQVRSQVTEPVAVSDKNAVQKLESAIKQKEPEPVPAVVQKTEPTPVLVPSGDKNGESGQEQKPGSRFFRGNSKEEKGNSTPAVVQGEQTVSDGSTLLMRTLEDTYSSDGVLIPKNTYISGIVRLTEERLNIQIQSVRIGKNIYKVSKSIYDLDGLMGLNVPENVKAELARQASARALENTNARTGGSGIIDKVGGAVGDAAKSVLSKDKREIKVTVKNNYKIFLK